MNSGATFKANANTTYVVEPCAITHDYPAIFARITAMLGSAVCDHQIDAVFAKFPAMLFGVVAAIGVNDFGPLKRPATYTADRRNGIDEDVTFGTGPRALRGIQASFSHAPAARTGDESPAVCEKWSWPASRTLASISSSSWFHTPAFCQSRKLHQQVRPQPNPNLIDRSHQRVPVLNTDRTPFSAARSETGRRPGYFLRHGLRGSNKGSISAHN